MRNKNEKTSTSCSLCYIENNKYNLYKQKIKYGLGWVHTVCKNTCNEVMVNKECIECGLYSSIVS